MKHNIARVVSLLLPAVLLGVAGCQKDAPVGPETQPNASRVHILALPKAAALNKLTYITEDITVNHGGVLRMHYEEKSTESGKKIFSEDIEIKFDKGSVSDDFTASLTTDAYYMMSTVDLEFGPHGTQFLKPARVRVHVQGLDLSAFTDTDQLHLYYNNNGTWELMPGKVHINVQSGELRCDDGELPHFSQYCFGY